MSPDDSEYRYNRVLTLVEVCTGFGIEIEVHPVDYLIRFTPASVMDEHPELMASLVEWKPDMVAMLRHLDGMEDKE